MCSLNPHAGENGILGREEIEEFHPAIEVLRAKGIDITNPKPADTLFAKAAKHYLQNEKQPYDVYCACYHDQGLIPVKVLAMDKTVNMTAGLSIIRTSPAHGTAYDIAGQNIADESKDDLCNRTGYLISASSLSKILNITSLFVTYLFCLSIFSYVSGFLQLIFCL